MAVVARSAKIARSTVQKAVSEVDAGVDPAAPVRRAGAGRKRLIDKDANLLVDLDDLVEPEARGDPECPLRWASKSTGNLADALVAVGHEVSPDTVGRLLRAMGYSLQATAKQREGVQHPDRDTQFVYLSNQVGDHVRSGDPVILSTRKRRCDTRSHAASGLADWRSGLCRLRSSGPVLDGLAPPLTCVAGNGGVRSSRGSRRTPVPSGGYGQGADRTGERK
jgi:hypothetical protein